jgi:hypothetical protein
MGGPGESSDDEEEQEIDEEGDSIFDRYQLGFGNEEFGDDDAEGGDIHFNEHEYDSNAPLDGAQHDGDADVHADVHADAHDLDVGVRLMVLCRDRMLCIASMRITNARHRATARAAAATVTRLRTRRRARLLAHSPRLQSSFISSQTTF